MKKHIIGEEQRLSEKFIVDCLPKMIYNENSKFSVLYRILTEGGSYICELIDDYLKKETTIEPPYKEDDIAVELDLETHKDLKIIKITLPNKFTFPNTYIVYQLNERMEVVNPKVYCKAKINHNYFYFQVNENSEWKICWENFLNEDISPIEVIITNYFSINKRNYGFRE